MLAGLDERAEQRVDQVHTDVGLVRPLTCPAPYLPLLCGIGRTGSARLAHLNGTTSDPQPGGDHADEGAVQPGDLLAKLTEGRHRSATTHASRHRAGQKAARPHRCGTVLFSRCPSHRSMDLVVASNFDDRLVADTAELPVVSFFGGYPVLLTGGGRPPRILPPIGPERFREHLAVVHQANRTFYATLNSSDLGLKEYRPGYVEQFLREVGELLDLGVDGLVLALPALIEAVRREWPDVPISVSTFARIRTVTQAEYFLNLGARTIILEEANRDFRLIRGLVRAGAEVEVLVNQSCLPSCPFRGHHLNTSSLASQPGAECPIFEYPILECGLEYLRDPAKLLSGIFVRPEDLAVYEEAGVSRFKISGRNRPTEWLVKVARAYAARSYPGDLADVLSLVQLKGPRAALRRIAGDPGAAVAASLARAFEPLEELFIDNTAFPPDFLRRIAEIDCEHTSCTACGFCRRVAEKVVRIGGKPLSAYRVPADLRPALELLPVLGGPGEQRPVGRAPLGATPP